MSDRNRFIFLLVVHIQAYDALAFVNVFLCDWKIVSGSNWVGAARDRHGDRLQPEKREPNSRRVAWSVELLYIVLPIFGMIRSLSSRCFQVSNCSVPQVYTCTYSHADSFIQVWACEKEASWLHVSLVNHMTRFKCRSKDEIGSDNLTTFVYFYITMMLRCLKHVEYTAVIA